LQGDVSVFVIPLGDWLTSSFLYKLFLACQEVSTKTNHNEAEGHSRDEKGGPCLSFVVSHPSNGLDCCQVEVRETRKCHFLGVNGIIVLAFFQKKKG
jgi:hypothetical protein